MNINDFKRKGFLPFCIEEIKLAFGSGIDPELISRYMNDTGFDNLQLRQIRLGLEQDLDVSAYARITMPCEEMEKIRERLLEEKSERDIEAEKEKKLEQQQIKVEVNRKRLHNTLSFFRIIMVILFIAVFIGLIYAGKIIYDIWNEDLFIRFRKDKVTLEYKEPFIPEDQIEDHSQGRNIMIIYPSFNADELGEYTVTYQLSNGLRSIQKDLKIRVVDTTAPVITLKQDEISLIREEDVFEPEEYVKELYDSCDSDPELTTGRLDWKLDEQDVTYVVSDASGNRSMASLHALIKDRPVSNAFPSGNNSSHQESHTGGSSNDDNHDSSESHHAPETTPQVQKAAAVYCHSVSVPPGTDPGTAAYSTYDGLSGNITISIQYPELNTSVPGTYPVYYIDQATGETVSVAYVTVTE